MKQFVDQYKKVKPYLITDKKVDTREAIPQTIEEREKLDGLYECIMCGCCSTACPSSGGTLINFWDQQLYYKLTGLLLTVEIRLQKKD